MKLLDRLIWMISSYGRLIDRLFRWRWARSGRFEEGNEEHKITAQAYEKALKEIRAAAASWGICRKRLARTTSKSGGRYQSRGQEFEEVEDG